MALLQVLKPVCTGLLQSVYELIQFEDTTMSFMDLHPHGKLHKIVNVQICLGECKEKSIERVSKLCMLEIASNVRTDIQFTTGA